MWCTLDAGEIPADSPNLYFDQQQWLHRNAVNWHTLTGEFAHEFSWTPRTHASSGGWPVDSPVAPLLPMKPPHGNPGAPGA